MKTVRASGPSLPLVMTAMIVLSTLSSSARADSTVAAAPVAARPASKSPRRVVTAGFSVTGIIRLGATAMAPATSITPDEKTLVGQSIGIGYAVSPRIILMLSAVFIETVASQMGPRGFTFGAVTPWAVARIAGGLSFGLGPMLWYREFGTTRADYGAFVTLLYGFKIGTRLGMNLSITAPQIYGNRFAVALSGGVGFGYRF